jgi:hypothetical protein
MKVRVSFTLEIDPKAWEGNYGVAGAREIRADVQEHARNTVLDAFGHAGNLAGTDKTYYGYWIHN